ncbi:MULTISPECIES: hypothetical protein [Mycolicibacter]|uniref:Uncharacterized protein n=2 Tax=Mycolicibacter TaxID=1073531 RepID=A0ABU5XMX7_9MYCO|nr:MULTISPECIES: hypothetical protein [unclassified Mycolicibacter]MEB3023339.1 hypothetical protein [Mycolicibacter sp. MYC098]MEB3035125.1 hypothetical protein [Mycolicibacter sp. MYC340]
MSLYGEYYGPADDQDLALQAARQHNRDALSAENGGLNPLCGDIVEFPTGEQLRISYVWPGPDGGPGGIQTSYDGSGRWYWSNSGDMDFSGSLNSSIPAETLSPTGKTAPVTAWIFHHDLKSAHRSVDLTAQVAVWTTTTAIPA